MFCEDPTRRKPPSSNASDADADESSGASSWSSALELYEREKDNRRPTTVSQLQSLRDRIVAGFPALADRLRAYFANEIGAANLFADAGLHQPGRPEFVNVQPFGRYSVVEEEALGWGGLGSVFKAQDKLLGRHVALKIPVA